jgi:hypothetical protein
MLLSPFLARRRSVIPFFALLALIIPALSLGVPVLTDLFYLLPFYENMHGHSPGRILWVYPFIPSMLAGAAVNELPRLASMRGNWLVALVPLGLLAIAIRHMEQELEITASPWLWTAILLATALLLVIVVLPRQVAPATRQRAVNGVIALLVAAAFLIPNGVDIVQSLTRDDPPPGELVMWGNDPWMQDLIQESLRRDDPDGAGEFLLQQQQTQPPFRFIAYGGMYHPDTVRRTYPERRLDPAMVAILQNARPMRLGLETTQGYNPLQPLVYQEFIHALNGERQNYHYANLLHTGVISPLLDLLNVRYIVVDRNIPEDRRDHMLLAAIRTEVYRDENVIIYESPTVQPRAWVVYDVRPAGDGEGLEALASGEVDGAEVAFVEGDLPPVTPPSGGAAPEVTISGWSPDGLTIEVTHAGEGLLVVSEVYSEGWRATVDGEEVDILQADHALLGIPLGLGEHTVELRYEPASLTLGLWISGFGGIGAVAILAYAGWDGIMRRRNEDRGADAAGPLQVA